jgi:hypothetical protein
LPFLCSSIQAVAVTSVALHLNLVLTVLDVKLRAWKTGEDFNVFALKAKVEIDVKMCPEVVRFMQIPQTRLTVCA